MSVPPSNATTDQTDLLDLSGLSGKVANVQAELQLLDEAVQQTKQQIRTAQLNETAASARHQGLKEQLQQDVEVVHALQAQQDDLLALRVAQQQGDRLPDRQKDLQVHADAFRCKSL